MLKVGKHTLKCHFVGYLFPVIFSWLPYNSPSVSLNSISYPCSKSWALNLPSRTIWSTTNSHKGKPLNSTVSLDGQHLQIQSKIIFEHVRNYKPYYWRTLWREWKVQNRCQGQYRLQCYRQSCIGQHMPPFVLLGPTIASVKQADFVSLNTVGQCFTIIQRTKFREKSYKLSVITHNKQFW